MDLSAPAPSFATARAAAVARYDDDYPLLFGEPARQPEWDAATRTYRLPADAGTRRETGAPVAATAAQPHRP